MYTIAELEAILKKPRPVFEDFANDGEIEPTYRWCDTEGYWAAEQHYARQLLDALKEIDRLKSDYTELRARVDEALEIDVNDDDDIYVVWCKFRRVLENEDCWVN